MKKYAFLLSILLSTILNPVSANASPAGESLGACMVDSLTGKERKQLAQWIFFAMAAHPDIKEFSKVSVDAQSKTNEYVGSLVTRLLTENCSEQVKVAAKEDGQAAFTGAFELVGKVAMQELMSNKEVVASISGYAKFLDEEKLGAVLKTK
jgi:hypothetical protein